MKRIPTIIIFIFGIGLIALGGCTPPTPDTPKDEYLLIGCWELWSPTPVSNTIISFNSDNTALIREGGDSRTVPYEILSGTQPVLILNGSILGKMSIITGKGWIIQDDFSSGMYVKCGTSKKESLEIVRGLIPPNYQGYLPTCIDEPCTSYCGNSRCEPNENHTSCEEDCECPPLNSTHIVELGPEDTIPLIKEFQFHLCEGTMSSIRGGGEDVELLLEFLPPSGYNRGELIVNDHRTGWETDGATLTKNLDAYVQKGDNTLKFIWKEATSTSVHIAVTTT